MPAGAGCRWRLSAGGQENQPTLLRDITWLFISPSAREAPLPLVDERTTRTVERGHGRTADTRVLTATTELVGYSDWRGLAQVFRLEHTWHEDGSDLQAVHYGVTSLPPEVAGPERLLALKRAHWQIENEVDDVKDVTLGEDRSLIHVGRAGRDGDVARYGRQSDPSLRLAHDRQSLALPRGSTRRGRRPRRRVTRYSRISPDLCWVTSGCNDADRACKQGLACSGCRRVDAHERSEAANREWEHYRQQESDCVSTRSRISEWKAFDDFIDQRSSGCDVSTGRHVRNRRNHQPAEMDIQPRTRIVARRNDDRSVVMDDRQAGYRLEFRKQRILEGEDQRSQLRGRIDGSRREGSGVDEIRSDGDAVVHLGHCQGADNGEVLPRMRVSGCQRDERPLRSWVRSPAGQVGRSLVEVTVPLTVTVEPWMDIDGWEAAVLQAARQAMGAALPALVSAQESLGPCPVCGVTDAHWDCTRPRVRLTSFGRVVVRLHRVRCRACGHRHRPAAALLSVLGRGNTTAALRTAAIAAGSSWPFATAARLLGELLGPALSPEQVRQLTIVAGQQVAGDLQAATTALVAPAAAVVPTERSAATERTRHGSRPVAARPAPARLLVGLDGGWVPSREQAGGMEGKVGVVATGVTTIAPGRHALVPRRYVATFDAATVVGRLTYAAADALGGTQSPTQIVIGDGAEWITHQARLHFPEATGILDWAHLARVIVRAVRLACPRSGQWEQRRATYHRVAEQVWHGEVTAATTTLVALRDPERDCPALEEALTYLGSQRDWLGNDAAWQAAGYPIGSGLIERAVALVINWRMHDRGMRWT